MAQVVFWLLMLTAFAFLFQAWPYLTIVRKHSPMSYIFPTRRNLSLPEFGQMWRHLRAFYLLLAAAIIWGMVFLLPATK